MGTCGWARSLKLRIYAYWLVGQVCLIDCGRPSSPPESSIPLPANTIIRSLKTRCWKALPLQTYTPEQLSWPSRQSHRHWSEMSLCWHHISQMVDASVWPRNSTDWKTHLALILDKHALPPLRRTTFRIFEWGTSQARRRQLRASSGGSSDATSKASFPLHNTEARQHQGNLDVTSDGVLSCCCCPSAGAHWTDFQEMNAHLEKDAERERERDRARERERESERARERERKKDKENNGNKTKENKCGMSPAQVLSEQMDWLNACVHLQCCRCCQHVPPTDSLHSHDLWEAANAHELLFSSADIKIKIHPHEPYPGIISEGLGAYYCIRFLSCVCMASIDQCPLLKCYGDLVVLGASNWCEFVGGIFNASPQPSHLRFQDAMPPQLHPDTLFTESLQVMTKYLPNWQLQITAIGPSDPWGSLFLDLRTPRPHHHISNGCNRKGAAWPSLAVLL